jgi:hypothetical protein
MSRKLFYLCFLKAGMTGLLLALFFPLSANAASHILNPPQLTCTQAPASVDPTSLSSFQLESYGLPMRPPSSAGSQAQARWLHLANRIKHDRHDCHPQRAIGSFAHHPIPTPDVQQGQRNIISNVTKITDAAWAGNFDVAHAGTYSFSSANWNLPCMNTGTREAVASFWVGIGGFGNGGGSGYTPQAGTDVHVDAAGNVSYTYWIEDTGSNDYIDTYQMPNAGCGNTMYVEVDSPVAGANVYYIVDGGGVDQSFTQNWPVTAGDSGECFVERVHGQTLADFNYIAFSNCYMNGNGIGNWPHNYYVMVNSSGQEMAGPGPITNNGLNYNVNWYLSH